MGAAVGGAPAGVVEPPRLNKEGFAGVAAPIVEVLFADGANKEVPVLLVLPNNAPGCEVGALVVGVEALFSFWAPNNPLENAFVVGVEEVFAALVGGVEELCPKNPAGEAGLAPPPKMLELDAAAWEPPNSAPLPPVGVDVDDPDVAPNKDFCSAGLAAAFPRNPPLVFGDAGVALLLLVFPKENPVLAGVVDCPPKRLGEDAAGVVVVPNKLPVAGAPVVVLLDCPKELVPKVKDMIASVCGMRVSVCVCMECDDADNRGVAP